jgi:NAD(P) transhydrogenase subunit alpha
MSTGENTLEYESRITVGVPKETFPGERRVTVVPATVSSFIKAGIDVLIESGAGDEAGFLDAEYSHQGATLISQRSELFAKADVILSVRAAGANPETGPSDNALMREGQCLIASCDPLSEPHAIPPIAERHVTCFSLEMLPRITRAQSMDVLSSMATIAGYKAVLLAANHLPRMFPMMMTAAGTITPAKVFIMGAGVAGLQAIATARRLGAVVQAYDVRPVVKEQVESLGGKFVEMELESGKSETAGGYAKEMDEEFYRKQRALMTKVVAANDVVITTAAIPGRKAPILVTAEMVSGMQPGSVIVDLAAERGGNCELTKPGETVVEHGVTIVGPDNLASTVPYHASEMLSKNISTFLLNLVTDGKLQFDLDDEIVRDTMLTRNGEVLNARVRDLLEMEPLEPAPHADEKTGDVPADQPEALEETE